jgi:hypothetical protein
MEDGTVVAIYQGFRSSNPELDFIVKYKEPNKRLRTPSHTHWVVDLVIKGEVLPELTLELVNELLNIYDSVSAFTDPSQRDEYDLIYPTLLTHPLVGPVHHYSALDNVGGLSIQLIMTLVELFSRCEKNNEGAFMFRGMLHLCKQYLEGEKDYYQIIGTSKRV